MPPSMGTRVLMLLNTTALCIPYQQHASNEQLHAAYPMAADIVQRYERDFTCRSCGFHRV